MITACRHFWNVHSNAKRAFYCPRRRGFNNIERISCLCVRSFTDSTLELVRPELNLLVLVLSDPNSSFVMKSQQIHNDEHVGPNTLSKRWVDVQVWGPCSSKSRYVVSSATLDVTLEGLLDAPKFIWNQFCQTQKRLDPCLHRVHLANKECQLSFNKMFDCWEAHIRMSAVRFANARRHVKNKHVFNNRTWMPDVQSFQLHFRLNGQNTKAVLSPVRVNIKDLNLVVSFEFCELFKHRLKMSWHWGGSVWCRNGKDSFVWSGCSSTVNCDNFQKRLHDSIRVELERDIRGGVVNKRKPYWDVIERQPAIHSHVKIDEDATMNSSPKQSTGGSPRTRSHTRS